MTKLNYSLKRAYKFITVRLVGDPLGLEGRLALEVLLHCRVEVLRGDEPVHRTPGRPIEVPCNDDGQSHVGAAAYSGTQFALPVELDEPKDLGGFPQPYIGRVGIMGEEEVGVDYDELLGQRSGQSGPHGEQQQQGDAVPTVVEQDIAAVLDL